MSPRWLAAWVSTPLPANFPLKKAKVNWAHTARWMPGFALPGANYGTTLDKSQHMLWKALRITAWQFLTMCSCNSCQRQCWKMSNMLIYVYQICPVLYAGADWALWVETGWGRRCGGRKEIPLSPEVPWRHGWSLKQLLLSGVLWRKIAKGTSASFCNSGKSEAWTS